NFHSQSGIIANSLWISTGILGSGLNLALFIVVLLDSATGFYRTLTLALAVVDFCCSFVAISQATVYTKIGTILYCVDYGISGIFPRWLNQFIWIAWVDTFYGELSIITYAFVWRAVLISNSRYVHMVEHKLCFVILALATTGIAYCDYTIDCSVGY
ncbi:hypothetical protein PMAYCL1PPCAC_33090, partial [Pristionchus mayeri]